ncbi:exodeoxyribonuclease VII large subunit [Psychroflexus sp. YR1-1]|uniref:Exodeoxyribonuclease 7 large subunit n=1 Tax=Psychroflexus aurantiacus TaxID=2709310 RepID=A0A6B3QYG0_9FLAO|nr:exodeoxyribonuclease VII large subunit [Psychroflexus aurantiacus]NEV93216.1 exodeoxyribonuclease VII large subunit [Psychroflexus aurantiacus]
MPSTSTTSVFTLLDIGRSLQRMISTHYNKPYWIKTEIAKLNAYTKSGHCYPDLVEKQNGQVLAQMRATIWSDTFKTISRQFEETTKKPISEGMTVLLLAKVNYHPSYGFSLNILDIDAGFTLGEMAKEKLESLKRLKAEGIFDLNKSLVFPQIPQRIAVISVNTSKGYQDFMNIISQSRSPFHFKIELFPALLQGDKAITSIAEALENIKTRKKEFDVVTIIRGGGGDVGLSCYDSFALASKVARFPLPVISGIGHSTNETLVEMVTFANKITPTDVAYFFISIFQERWEELQNLHSKLTSSVTFKLKEEQQNLKHSHQDFKTQVNALLQNHNYQLKEQRQRIKSMLPSLIRSGFEHLQNSGHRLRWLTQQQVQSQKLDLFQLSKTLQKESKSKIENQHQQLTYLTSTLSLLSPERLLSRGYTLNLVKDKIIKSATELKPGDRLKTMFSDGYAESDVVKIEPHEKN